MSHSTPYISTPYFSTSEAESSKSRQPRGRVHLQILDCSVNLKKHNFESYHCLWRCLCDFLWRPRLLHKTTARRTIEFLVASAADPIYPHFPYSSPSVSVFSACCKYCKRCVCCSKCETRPTTTTAEWTAFGKKEKWRTVNSQVAIKYPTIPSVWVRNRLRKRGVSGSHLTLVRRTPPLSAIQGLVTCPPCQIPW